MEASDIEQIVSAIDARLGSRVDALVTERMADIQQAIEQIRDEFTQTVSVLEGNDNALLGEIRKWQGAESWAEFIRAEAGKLGMSVIVAKS